MCESLAVSEPEQGAVEMGEKKDMQFVFKVCGLCAFALVVFVIGTHAHCV